MIHRGVGVTGVRGSTVLSSRSWLLTVIKEGFCPGGEFNSFTCYIWPKYLTYIETGQIMLLTPTLQCHAKRRLPISSTSYGYEIMQGYFKQCEEISITYS